MKYKICLLIVCIFGILSWFLYSNKEVDSKISKNVSHDDLAIMVYDESKKDYVKQNEFPKGGYVLGSDSYCENGMPIGTYDSENGIMITNPTQSDKCYYFFDMKAKAATITSIDVTYNYSGYANLLLNVTGNAEKYYYYVSSTIDQISYNKYYEGISRTQEVKFDCGDTNLWVYIEDETYSLNLYHKILNNGGNEICAGGPIITGDISQPLPNATNESDTLVMEIKCINDSCFTRADFKFTLYLKHYDNVFHTYSYIQPNIIELD